MSSSSTKPLVFISYAHLDEPDPPEQPRWLSFVMEFLRPGVKGRKYEVWMDRLMPGGADWSPEIEAKIRTCDIFVLLVSTRSTGSDYILDNEMPIVRERQRNNDGVYFYPLLLDWTPKAGLEQVNDKNLRPRDAKPFSSLSPSERSRAMSEAADEIADVARAIDERRTAAAAARERQRRMRARHQKAASAPRRRADIFGLERIAPGLNIERIAPIAESARAAPIVDITGLPETGYERLVGRDAELARLDEAWSDDKTNVLSLIAEGGAGKSALVNEWLMRLQAGGYYGAERVLGWSFYSQGSRERATAADEFLNWALIKLDVNIDTTSASAKGEAVAEALTTRRVLLVLDGVEPLQHGPGPQAGQLKDQGLRALLRRFAAASPQADHSLIVLTSRVAVVDIKRFKDGAAPVVDVEKLSDEAGAELLRDNDVWGIDKELRAASREFGGHPLALTLLASLIKETQNGDVRRRDHIRGLLADADNPHHDQARRVMESYEKEWLADQPALLAILQCVGLFERPASGDCLTALRAKPAIHDLTDALVGLSDEQWRHTVARLREVRLLAPVDPSDTEALGAHPLVREWFGERLKQTNEAAWEEAHGRLYDHLRDTTHEGKTPTLADLAPLYHAIAHGCRAGRYQEALDEVYADRICRRFPDGVVEFYSANQLGAVGSDLAAIAWFFDRPYETPAAALTPPYRAWVLADASTRLRAQGRLREALPAMRTGLRMFEVIRHWRNAAPAASNLSQTELLSGQVAPAVATAKKAVALADRASGAFQMMLNRATRADALHAAGEWDKAAALFEDAERRQRQQEPENPLLYSLQGYQYCDLLLSRTRAGEARDRAAQTIEVAGRNNWILAVALDTLTLGRACLVLALQSPAGEASAAPASADAHAAGAKLDKAVEGLRAAGANEFIARGLLAHAAFRRAIGDWDGAKSDLDEAKEIAESGSMRLYWCDCALEGARLALARREAFAPLNGLVEPSPPPPALPDATSAAALKEEARKELDVARKLIAECGYHRRDEELAELDEVVTGRRRFADLPPRV
jgi:tetratricopeptide (TPR) repeat protein